MNVVHLHIRRVEDVDVAMDMAEDVEEEDLVEGVVEVRRYLYIALIFHIWNMNVHKI